MAESPTRLPVQHRRRPHCPTCGADLPTFPSAKVDLSAADLDDADLLEIRLVFRVRCACGRELDLRKDMRMPA